MQPKLAGRVDLRKPSCRARIAVAQLQGVNLKEAALQGADLGVAELQGANLEGAQLQGADLRPS